eukprot:366072-Chlamydomonas_euryale.AAC.3
MEQSPDATTPLRPIMQEGFVVGARARNHSPASVWKPPSPAAPHGACAWRAPACSAGRGHGSLHTRRRVNGQPQHVHIHHHRHLKSTWRLPVWHPVWQAHGLVASGRTRQRHVRDTPHGLPKAGQWKARLSRGRPMEGKAHMRQANGRQGAHEAGQWKARLTRGRPMEGKAHKRQANGRQGKTRNKRSSDASSLRCARQPKQQQFGEHCIKGPFNCTPPAIEKQRLSTASRRQQSAPPVNCMPTEAERHRLLTVSHPQQSRKAKRPGSGR